MWPQSLDIWTSRKNLEVSDSLMSVMSVNKRTCGKTKSTTTASRRTSLDVEQKRNQKIMTCRDSGVFQNIGTPKKQWLYHDAPHCVLLVWPCMALTTSSGWCIIDVKFYCFHCAVRVVPFILRIAQYNSYVYRSYVNSQNVSWLTTSLLHFCNMQQKAALGAGVPWKFPWQSNEGISAAFLLGSGTIGNWVTLGLRNLESSAKFQVHPNLSGDV